MEVTYSSWEAMNTGRSYPISELATGVDDAGGQVPAALLAGARIWVDTDQDIVVFLSSYMVSPALISMTFSYALRTAMTAAVFSPLAVVVTPWTDADSFITADLEAIGDIPVYGHVVIGTGSAISGKHGTLSTPQQGFLADDVVTILAAPGIRDVSTMQAAPMTGDVGLVLDSPLTVHRNGGYIELGLLANADILAKFAGTYNTTGGCRRVPITSIRDVVPDAAGNITVTFTGFNVTAGTNGIGLAAGISAEEYCDGKRNLPDENGVIPSRGTSKLSIFQTPIEIPAAGLNPTSIDAGISPNWYQATGIWYGTSVDSDASITPPTVIIATTMSATATLTAADASSAMLRAGPVTATGGNGSWTVEGGDVTSVTGSPLVMVATVASGNITITLNGTQVFSDTAPRSFEQCFTVLGGNHAVTMTGFSVTGDRP